MYRDLAGHELIMIGPDNCIDTLFFFFSSTSLLREVFEPKLCITFYEA